MGKNCPIPGLRSGKNAPLSGSGLMGIDALRWVWIGGNNPALTGSGYLGRNIQYATIGFSGSGWLRSATCFTSDDPDQTTKRIAAYKAALLFVAREARNLRRERALQFKLVKPRFGTVVFVGKDGQHVKTVHVKDVPDVFKLYPDLVTT